MRKRKLQVFVSSTYSDLIPERLQAMEAILKAGHIPAAMEQFAPGDESALEKIKRWIDESDAFMLILGGRYGSLEPESGKSYVEIEYDYALEKKKPFFSLVIEEKAFDCRVRERGLEVDEREQPARYKEFKQKVCTKHCGFWRDGRDIENAILHKLPDWAQKEDVVGWMRGDEATSPQVLNEMARLSEENRELRQKLATDQITFLGLDFDTFVKLLREDTLDFSSVKYLYQDSRTILRRAGLTDLGLESPQDQRCREDDVTQLQKTLKHSGMLFDTLMTELASRGITVPRYFPDESNEALECLHYLLLKLRSHALVVGSIIHERDDALFGERRGIGFELSDVGRQLKNRLMLAGDRRYRERLLWRVDGPGD